MVRFVSFLLLLSALLLPAPASAQEGTPTPAAGVTLSAPLPGQAVQGAVAITGSSLVEGFQAAEISFRYSAAPQGGWFLIAEAGAPVSGTLAQWDTTTLTDGVYDLRLRVTLASGESLEAILPGVRVRNYTPVETDTPAPPATQAAGQATATATPQPSPTPSASPIPPTGTPFGPNPAQFTPFQFGDSLVRGALAAVGLFALMALYGSVRSLRRRP